jgi:hypothetical protein
MLTRWRLTPIGNLAGNRRERLMTRNEELAERIVERMDASRLDCYGGYPSSIAYRGRAIIIASVDHDGRPTLTIQTIAAFVRDNSEWLDEAP